MRVSVKAANYRLFNKISRLVNLVAQTFRRGLRNTGQNIVSEVQARRLMGRPGLIPRTYKFLRSIKYKVISSGNTYLLKIYSTMPWIARTQEEGRLITPVRAKKLAIPQGPALGSAGEKIYPSPLRALGLFRFRIINGRSVLVFKDQPDIVTHCLEPVAKIPPRFKFFETTKRAWTDRLPTLRSELLEALKK